MLTLLWPPAIELEDMSLIYSDTAYLYSTFELQAHGNINASILRTLLELVMGLLKLLSSQEQKFIEECRTNARTL